MEVTINGVKKEVSKEEMKDRVIGYYDALFGKSERIYVSTKIDNIFFF